MTRKEWVWVTIRCFMSVIIIIGIVGSWWLNAIQYEEYAVVDILASREPELGVPVYAQFSVSQEVVIKERMPIARLIVPMYIPQEVGPATVTLAGEGEQIKKWQLNEYVATDEAGGILEVKLPLDQEAWLRGRHTITVEAADISYDEQDRAPKVFVEKDDSTYPDGSYQIAGISKAGDVSLRVMARRQRWQRYAQEWQNDNARVIVSTLAYIIILIILGAAPHVLLRWWK